MICADYDPTIAEMVDKYAPIITKTMFDTHNVPWYTPSSVLWTVVEENTSNSSPWYVSPSTLKCAYYSNKINKCNGSQKAIFNVVKNVLHRKQDIPLNSFDSQQTMADGFSRYFQQKIQTIRFDTPAVEQNESIPYCQYCMSSFKRLS